MSKLSKRRTWGFNKMVLKAIKREIKDVHRRGFVCPAFGGPEWEVVESALDSLSFDDILRGCINDSDLTEIICVLDMIVQENGFKLRAFKDDKYAYPKPETPESSASPRKVEVLESEIEELVVLASQLATSTYIATMGSVSRADNSDFTATHRMVAILNEIVVRARKSAK